MITFDGDVARDLQYSLDYQHFNVRMCCLAVLCLSLAI